MAPRTERDLESSRLVINQDGHLVANDDIAVEEIGDPNQRVENLVDIPDLDKAERQLINFKTLWAFTGPGFLMSIAYLDPGNLESDIQAGATGGYSLLWVLLWSTIVGFWLQMLASRLGVASGKHLAELCKDHYPRTPRILLWIMTEIAIIGSDIQEVIGTAIAIQILSNGHVPLWAGVLITAADTFTFLLLENYGVRKLEVFFCSLIGVMVLSFGVEYCISKPDQVEVIKGIFVPYVAKNNITEAVGILGAVVMPHNIYLHSALVQSRKIDHKNDNHIKVANKYFAIESSLALFISFIINLFIVSVFAVGFYGIPGGDDIGLSTAANYLGEKYGAVAKYIWAIGLLAAGQCSTMTGTYSGQFVMQGFLDLKIKPWKRLLITRLTAIVPAIVVAILAEGFLDQLDEYLNVLQSIQLPFAVLPVLYFTASEDIMGKFKNHWANNILVRFLSLVIIVINIYLIVVFATDISEGKGMIAGLVIGFFFYFAFIAYLAIGVERCQRIYDRCRSFFGCSSVKSIEQPNDYSILN
eukprot:gene2524-3126_t